MAVITPTKATKKVSKPRKKHRTEGEILKIAKDFRKWATEEMDDPKSRRLSAEKFFLLRDIADQVLARWAERFPEFKRIYKEGLQAIGIKREQGMMRKELSEKSTMFRMHAYLPGWLEAQKYHDKRERETGSTLIEAFKSKLFALNKLGEKSDESPPANGDKK